MKRAISIHVAMHRNLEGWTFVIISDYYGKIAHWAMWDVLFKVLRVEERTRQV